MLSYAFLATFTFFLLLHCLVFPFIVAKMNLEQDRKKGGGGGTAKNAQNFTENYTGYKTKTVEYLFSFLEPPTAAKGKHTGTQSSSSPAKVVVPVLLAVILVAALIGVYYIRRRRNEARIRKAINRSQTHLVDNGDLNAREYDSSDELQEIFPSG